ncbi:hypothetical protein TrCOL_g598 [Triparma columacea]|uniref:Core Histone H2A/H2B/H3 domain-containing protein n=1 Tax=Triparma columacea TaxID=722753 RepID=A0A9W7GJS0_9STRA|nr:hypothetical protein TrCOL_g598 [Triparma columacea]
MEQALSQVLDDYSSNEIASLEALKPHQYDWKSHILPLARIKKIMKSEDPIRSSTAQPKLMISSEGPLLFSKACEIFIGEVAIRSWMNTCEKKRRTVQKSDVQAALNRSDMFDFLIDIVPRLTGNVHSESTADASDSAADISGASEDPNDIPTISPHHACSMMMQAMARKVQQEQIAASVDPALYAMMQGFGGGPVQNVSDGTQGGDDDVQRVLADQWQKQATEMIKKVEEEKKQKEIEKEREKEREGEGS